MANFVLPSTEKLLMEQLATAGASAGQIGEEMLNAWIKQQAALAPEATCTELGAVTDAQKAYVTLQIAAGAGIDTTVNPSATVTPKNGTRTPKARPTSKLTPAQEASLQAHVMNTMAQKQNVSNNSSIAMFFVARPTSAEYIDEGTKGIIKSESWKNIADKIASGEYVVVDDFQDKEGNTVLSKSNYDVLAAAAAAKSETVPVMRNDKVGASIGYLLKVSDAPGAHGEEQAYPKTAMQHFVEMKAAGYIKAGADTMGVQLRTLTVKSNDPQKADTKRVVLSDTNKKAAVEANNYISVRKVTPTMEKKSQKSELVFYVNKKTVTTDNQGKKVVGANFQTDTKGNVRKFAIRATVECQVHALEMLKEYEGVFPSGKVDPTKPLDGEQLAKVAAATVQDLAITLSDRSATFVVDQRLQDALKELQEVINTEQAAPQNVTI